MIVVAAFAGSTLGDDWLAVKNLIDNFDFLPNMSFSAGDATGRKFTYTKGSLTMTTENVMMSSSKFPVAIAIAGAVVDRHLDFETKVHEVFQWWTSDPADNRSAVTLRHLLTFTSGFVSSDAGGAGMDCLDIFNGSKYTSEACAQQIYETGPFTAAPGTTWSYHSLHLQLAGAMAAKAANLTVQELLHKYLIDRLGMTGSFWYGGENPHLAAMMVSTGDDYDKLLQGVLSYTILPKAVIDDMERDVYSYFPVKTSPSPKDQILVHTIGHYSMCTYFECPNQQWSTQCEQNGVHADPGAYAYWPLVDRSKNFYMQLVVFRPVTLPDWVVKLFHITPDIIGALPAQCVSPLRYQLQAPVEKALNKSLAGGELSGMKPMSLPDPFAFLCKLSLQVNQAEVAVMV